jgi:hypothetical protein
MSYVSWPGAVNFDIVVNMQHHFRSSLPALKSTGSPKFRAQSHGRRVNNER